MEELLMKRVFSVAALAVFCMAGTLSAANVLAFEDYTVGTSALPGALALWGGCGVCTITNDSGTFNTDLTAGGWDVVIYAEQNNSTYPSSAAELTAYVGGGGKLIGDTWQTGGLDGLLGASQASENGLVITTSGDAVFAGLGAKVGGGGNLMGDTWQTGGLDGLLGASQASENGLVITTSGDAVFAGLGATINLTNPGWGILSQGWNPVGGAVGIGSLNSGGSAIILGNGGKTYLNAPLTDTYSPVSDGERLIANELGQLTGTPEPATFVGMGLGLAVLAMRRLRR